MKDSTQLEPLAHSPDRAANRIGISVRAIYTAIATGELRSFKIGKRRLITESEIQGFVQRKMTQAGFSLLEIMPWVIGAALVATIVMLVTVQ